MTEHPEEEPLEGESAEDLAENDEISPEEEAFLKGYEEDIESGKEEE